MPAGTPKVTMYGAGKVPVPGGSTTFNSPGTFTVPVGVTSVDITGKGGSGNSGGTGNTGGCGAGGAGGSGGNTVLNQYQPGGICCCTGCPLPGYYFTVGSSNAGNLGTGGAGNSGNGPSGASGNTGSAGNVGTASTAISRTFPGGAAGNGGAGGSGGAGGNAGGSGGSTTGYYLGPASTYNTQRAFGSGGNRGRSNLPCAADPANSPTGGWGGGGSTAGLTIIGAFNTPSYKVTGGQGGGGAGLTNAGWLNNYPGVAPTSPYYFLGNQGTPGGGQGGATPTTCAANGNVACGAPPAYVATNGFPGGNATATRAGGGGAGAGRGFRVGSSFPCYNWFNNPGGDGAAAAGGGGGGGGRGQVGNAGSAGNPGSAANPTSFNSVPVSPGASYPISVGSPGGQVVISWNPQ